MCAVCFCVKIVPPCTYCNFCRTQSQVLILRSDDVNPAPNSPLSPHCNIPPYALYPIKRTPVHILHFLRNAIASFDSSIRPFLISMFMTSQCGPSTYVKYTLVHTWDMTSENGKSQTKDWRLEIRDPRWSGQSSSHPTHDSKLFFPVELHPRSIFHSAFHSFSLE